MLEIICVQMDWYGIQSKAAIPDGFWQRMAGAWGGVQAGGRGDDSKRDRAPRRQLLPWWALVQVLYQHSYGITKLLWYGMVIRTSSFQKYVVHYYAFIFHQKSLNFFQMKQNLLKFLKLFFKANILEINIFLLVMDPLTSNLVCGEIRSCLKKVIK